MPHDLIQAVATVIRELRRQHGVTQEQLADAAGLDRTYISGVERAARNITLDSLEQIVMALDISLCDFTTLVSKHLQHKR